MDKVTTNTKKLPRFFNKSIEVTLATALILLIIISVLIFLFSGSVQLNNDNNNEEVMNNFPNIIEKVGKVIEVKDSKVINLNNRTISLNGDWRVLTIFQDYSENENFQCETGEQKDCTVYYVSSDVEKSYYISSPSALRAKSTLAGNAKESKIKIKDMDYKIFYQQVNLVRRDEGSNEAKEIDSTIFSEIYGCFYENACFSSGLLNIDDEVINRNQVREFEEFLKTLTIN